MHASSANVLSLVVLATSLVAPVFAAPVHSQSEKRAIGAIVGGLVKGAGEGLLEAGFDDIKDNLKRSNLEQRAAGAIIGGLVKGAGEGVLEAGAEDIKNDLGLRRRNINTFSITSVPKSIGTALPTYVGPFHGEDPERRSVGAIVDRLAEGTAEGAAEAGFDDIKNDLGLRKRAVGAIVGGLVKGAGEGIIEAGIDDLTGNNKRAVGAIVGGLVKGAGEGVLEAGAEDIKNDLGLRRRKSDLIQTLDGFHPAPGLEGRAVGAILGGIAKGVGSGVVSSFLENNDRREVINIPKDLLKSFTAAQAPSTPGSERRAVGAIVGGLVKGAGEGVLEAGFDKLKEALKRSALDELD